ncbi:hypothetical protein SEVIR_2G053250v4 [Setaria viridis]
MAAADRLMVVVDRAASRAGRADGRAGGTAGRRSACGQTIHDDQALITPDLFPLS